MVISSKCYVCELYTLIHIINNNLEYDDIDTLEQYNSIINQYNASELQNGYLVPRPIIQFLSNGGYILHQPTIFAKIVEIRLLNRTVDKKVSTYIQNLEHHFIRIVNPMHIAKNVKIFRHILFRQSYTFDWIQLLTANGWFSRKYKYDINMLLIEKNVQSDEMLLLIHKSCEIMNSSDSIEHLDDSDFISELCSSF